MCTHLAHTQQVHAHIEDAAMLNRPLLLSEVGSTLEYRHQYFESVLSAAERATLRQQHTVGVMLWMLGSRDYPDYDG